MTEFVLAVTLGLLFALGTFLVLRRDVVRVVWGVAIVSQAANVYLITVGVGPTGGSGAPILGHGHGGEAATVDPLVQALVLTAIVIGFGTTAFALVLTYRLYEEHGTIDLDDIAGDGDSGDAEGADARAETATDGGVSADD
jgi:multicomponent Na+:H+ antiporter subunit C